MGSQDTIIQVKDLVKRYGDVTAVAGLSFSVKAGEILTLLGPNGAGKTTTIKTLLGTVIPDDGEVSVYGFDTTYEPERVQASKHIGAVLEGARNTYWRLSARVNLLYFGLIRGVAWREIRQRGEYLLDLLDLPGWDTKTEVGKYSRGMQQKVAIATALIHDPEILLLDEPTLGLDVQSAKVLEAVILKMAEEGKTIILTTHSMPLAQRLGDRTLIINRGKRTAYDATEALLKEDSAHFEIKVDKSLTEDALQQIRAIVPTTVANETDNGTLIFPDNKHAYRILDILRDGGYELVSFRQREKSLEEVFLELTQE